MTQEAVSHTGLIGASVVLGIVLLYGPALALQFPSTGSTPTNLGRPVFPDAGVRGQELTVALKGVGFASGSSCSFGAGITVMSCGRAPSGQVVAKLRISPSALLGYRTVMINSRGGESTSLPKSFRVTLAGSGDDSGSRSATTGGGGRTIGGAGGTGPGGVIVSGDGGRQGRGSTDSRLGGRLAVGKHGSSGSPGGPGKSGGTGRTGGPGGSGGDVNPPAGDPPGTDDIIGEGPTDTIYDGPPGTNDHAHSYNWLPSPTGDGGPDWNDPFPPGPPGDPEVSTPDDWTDDETTVPQTQETNSSTVPGPGGLETVGVGALLLIGLVGRRRRAPTPAGNSR